MKRCFDGFKIRRTRCLMRGDTILEVVIATAILSTLLLATFDILQRALDTNVNVKNRVVALNIAREGVEAVRNLRDTNWLKYSGQRRSKWLCLEDPTDASPTCNGTTPNSSIINNNNPANETYYTIDFDEVNDRYYLERQPMQVEIDFDTIQLGRDDYRLYLTATSPQRYTHAIGGNTPTPFYRQVWLDIRNPYEAINATMQPLCGTGDSDNSCRNSRLNVVVRVFWQEDGRTRSSTLETNLFDFFERDEY